MLPKAPEPALGHGHGLPRRRTLLARRKCAGKRHGAQEHGHQFDPKGPWKRLPPPQEDDRGLGRRLPRRPRRRLNPSPDSPGRTSGSGWTSQASGLECRRAQCLTNNRRRASAASTMTGRNDGMSERLSGKRGSTPPRRCMMRRCPYRAALPHSESRKKLLGEVEVAQPAASGRTARGVTADRPLVRRGAARQASLAAVLRTDCDNG